MPATVASSGLVGLHPAQDSASAVLCDKRHLRGMRHLLRLENPQRALADGVFVHCLRLPHSDATRQVSVPRLLSRMVPCASPCVTTTIQKNPSETHLIYPSAGTPSRLPRPNLLEAVDSLAQATRRRRRAQRTTADSTTLAMRTNGQALRHRAARCREAVFGPRLLTRVLSGRLRLCPKSQRTRKICPTVTTMPQLAHEVLPR